MIYLASPYTHEQAAVMERRFELACAVVAELVKEDHVIYSPIAHFHPIAVRHELPRDFSFWQRQNLSMLSKADTLLVLRLDGWETSKGVANEIDCAAVMNIHTVHIFPEGYGVPSV